MSEFEIERIKKITNLNLKFEEYFLCNEKQNIIFVLKCLSESSKELFENWIIKITKEKDKLCLIKALLKYTYFIESNFKAKINIYHSTNNSWEINFFPFIDSTLSIEFKNQSFSGMITLYNLLRNSRFRINGKNEYCDHIDKDIVDSLLKNELLPLLFISEIAEGNFISFKNITDIINSVCIDLKKSNLECKFLIKLDSKKYETIEDFIDILRDTLNECLKFRNL